jgi:hypothetical protein
VITGEQMKASINEAVHVVFLILIGISVLSLILTVLMPKITGKGKGAV